MHLTRFECGLNFARFSCTLHFTRFQCSSSFTRFECNLGLVLVCDGVTDVLKPVDIAKKVLEFSGKATSLLVLSVVFICTRYKCIVHLHSFRV